MYQSLDLRSRGSFERLLRVMNGDNIRNRENAGVEAWVYSDEPPTSFFAYFIILSGGTAYSQIKHIYMPIAAPTP